LFAANNSQMQNGQGMFLSVGVLHVEGGRLELPDMQTVDTLPHPSPPVALDEDLQDQWGFLDPNRDWRHLGVSPRFPVAAETAQRMWAAVGRPRVRGVIAADPYLLEAILRETGPVAGPNGTVAVDDVVPYLLHDQYLAYFSGGFDQSFQQTRREELETIAVAAIDAFDELPSIEADLITDLAEAVSARHVMAWSDDPEVQAAWEAGQVDGQIEPTSMLLSLINRSGAKLDWFVDLRSELDVERRGDVLDCTLRITVRNRAPRQGEPRYVVGPYPTSDNAPGEYVGLVALNLPVAAANNRFTDAPEGLAVSGADGENRVIAAWINLERGQEQVLTARFELPVSYGEVTVEAGARPTATRWSFAGRRWSDTRPRTIDLIDPPPPT
jgi:hypothetical protein